LIFKGTVIAVRGEEFRVENAKEIFFIGAHDERRKANEGLHFAAKRTLSSTTRLRSELWRAGEDEILG
jgi:hypothetical protein